MGDQWKTSVHRPIAFAVRELRIKSLRTIVSKEDKKILPVYTSNRLGAIFKFLCVDVFRRKYLKSISSIPHRPRNIGFYVRKYWYPWDKEPDK